MSFARCICKILKNIPPYYVSENERNTLRKCEFGTTDSVTMDADAGRKVETCMRQIERTLSA